MLGIRSWRNKIAMLLVLGSVVMLGGCGYSIVRNGGILPEGQEPISHPTKQGYECFPTGYIYKMYEDIDECLAEPDKEPISH
jgi:hypothetical protein